jgi:hypothetical protein
MISTMKRAIALLLVLSLCALQSCSILFRGESDNVHRGRLLPSDYFEHSANAFGMKEFENMTHVDVHGLKIPESTLNVYEKYSKIQRKDSVSYVLVYQAGEIARVNKLIYKQAFPFPLTTTGFGGYVLWKSYKDKAFVDMTQDWVVNAAGVCLIVDASTGVYSIVRDLLQGNKKRWRLAKIVPLTQEEYERLTF